MAVTYKTEKHIIEFYICVPSAAHLVYVRYVRYPCLVTTTEGACPRLLPRATSIDLRRGTRTANQSIRTPGLLDAVGY